MEGDTEFRVIVSLEKYFNDERARCYMSAARGRPVRSLARRLRRTFALPRPFALVSRGHLLPPDEPLALLQPDDPVDVIPTTTELIAEKRVMQANGVEANGGDSPPSTKHMLIGEDQTDSIGAKHKKSPQKLDTGFQLHHKRQKEEPMEAEWCEIEGQEKRDITTQEQDFLLESKRRALQLLDELAPLPTRRRRRTRRRTPRATAPPDSFMQPMPSDSSVHPTPSNSSLLSTPSDTSVLPTPCDSSVVHIPSNSSVSDPPPPQALSLPVEAARAPRVVHSLST